MLFKKDKNVKHQMKKVDAVITGLVLGGIVASVYGIKKHEKNKLPQDNKVESDKSKQSLVNALIFGYKEEVKPKKQSAIKEFFSAFFYLLSKLLGKK